MAKLVLGIAVGLVVAFLAGWFWGSSGRSDAARALQTSELRGELLGARAAVLDARVAIYSVNFGEASQHLEGARGLLGRADDRLKSLGLDAADRQVQTALASIDAAQRMAGKLDPNANGRAGEAAKVIAEVLDTAAKRSASAPVTPQAGHSTRDRATRPHSSARFSSPTAVCGHGIEATKAGGGPGFASPPVTLVRSATGVGRELQERIFIISRWSGRRGARDW